MVRSRSETITPASDKLIRLEAMGCEPAPWQSSRRPCDLFDRYCFVITATEAAAVEVAPAAAILDMPFVPQLLRSA
jgi:hypothetical protein